MIYKTFNLTVNKSQEESEYFTFSGMASTNDLDRDNEIVMQGAFNKSLDTQKPILFNHNSDEPIGVTTLLEERDNGLYIEAKLPKNDEFVSKRIIPQMLAGSLTKMSIGAIPVRKSIEYREDGVKVFHEMELLETSIVPIPANKNADITNMKKFNLEEVKSITNKRDFENILRDSRLFSKSASVYIASLCNFESDSQDEFNKKMLNILNKMEKN
tara:strand:- start:1834 stop:2475 length:642 start_codon:yes stop_codon:yes gene_type:complete